MTQDELRKIIAESNETEWLNGLEVTFKSPYQEEGKILKGLASIYLHVSEEVEQWTTVGKNIPPIFHPSLKYFSSIKKAVDAFILEIATGVSFQDSNLIVRFDRINQKSIVMGNFPYRSTMQKHHSY